MEFLERSSSTASTVWRNVTVADEGCCESRLNDSSSSTVTLMVGKGEDGSNNGDSFQVLASRVYTFVIPILSVGGVIGNAMAILLVRTHTSLKRLPSSTYLALMALSSLLFLSTLFIEWIETMSGWKTIHHIAAMCKFTTFFGHFLDFLSSWLVVALSFERLVVLYRFTWRHKICTVQASQRICGAVVLCSVLFNTWVLYLANPRQIEGEWYCDILLEHESVFEVMLGVELVVTLILPALLIILINAVVISKLTYYRKFLPFDPVVRFRRGSKDPSGNTYGGSGPYVATTGPLLSATGSSVSRTGRNRSIRPWDLRLTKTLLLVTSLFICLNLPGYLFRVLEQFNLVDTHYDLRVIRFICFLLTYAHHCVLFYVYIFYSPQMKKQLGPMAMKLLECYCLKPVPDFGHYPPEGNNNANGNDNPLEIIN